MDKTILSLSLSGTILLTISGDIYADDLYGPTRSYAQSPMQSNALSNVLRNARSLPDDSIEAYTSLTAASVWAETNDYMLDYYHNQLEAGARWQVNEQWQWELNYRWTFAADNHLDNLTIAFHDFFGIGQNGRDTVDKHRFYVSVPEYGVDEEGFEGETLSSAISTYVQYQLYQDQHHALSVGGSLYYNDVNSGPFEGSSFEQGLQLNYGYQKEQHAIYAMFGMTHRNKEVSIADIPYRKDTLAFATGYRYAFTRQHHILAEYHIYQGATEGPDDFSDPSNEFVLGYRYVMDSSALEVLMIENARNMDNSTDIAFTFGYRYLFKSRAD
ncbi:TPA: DUF3187 family protein [Vibrio vulnificus]|nr:DUF3187 family protein [Vibrio vulnificus]HDY8059185.1 DUF3187 family protein [Vibrio vulnificus]HDY8078385.1 DUF3187 family protein [Vibrio vulnificus]HDY8188948.1 DUF3187 family protein [Vibrio vulnificus]